MHTHVWTQASPACPALQLHDHLPPTSLSPSLGNFSAPLWEQTFLCTSLPGPAVRKSHLQWMKSPKTTVFYIQELRNTTFKTHTQKPFKVRKTRVQFQACHIFLFLFRCWDFNPGPLGTRQVLFHQALCQFLLFRDRVLLCSSG